MTKSVVNVARKEGSQESSLSIWTSLAASLQSSQRALLERDLERLETATAEQRRLVRALQATEPSAGMQGTQNCLLPASGTAPVSTALHSAQLRVQSLARIQQSLLERAQRSLQLLSNLIAGPQAPYSAVPGRPGISVHSATSEANLFPSKEA